MFLTQVISEGIIVGVVLVIIGFIILYVINNTKLYKIMRLPEECKNWNKNHTMEITLFLIGFLTHIFFEITGLNKYYCDFGAACKKIINIFN